jgi:hypothetical protein
VQPFVAVQKQCVTYYECVSVALVIQQSKAHAQYCYMWPVWLYHIFPNYLIKGTIYGGEKNY